MWSHSHLTPLFHNLPVGWLCLESELPNPWRHKCHEQPGDDSHSAAKCNCERQQSTKNGNRTGPLKIGDNDVNPGSLMQIEASFCAAIETAMEQKSVSFKKRAETTYGEFVPKKRVRQEDVDSDYLFDNCLFWGRTAVTREIWFLRCFYAYCTKVQFTRHTLT